MFCKVLKMLIDNYIFLFITSSTNKFSLIISIMSNYYNKYLKYKNKYLQLKNQKGGILPPGLLMPIIPLCYSSNNSSSKIIIKAHGILNGKQFNLSSGINLITLTEIGNSVVLNGKFDRNIKDFYAENKYTIFKNNDTSLEKTLEGLNLEKTLNMVDENIKFKNHVGGPDVRVNDMMLQLICGGDMCSIDCISNFSPFSSDKKPKTETFNPRFSFKDRDGPITHILLSDFIHRTIGGTYDMPPSILTNYTFIVIACRTFSLDLSKKNIEDMEALSPPAIKN